MVLRTPEINKEIKLPDELPATYPAGSLTLLPGPEYAAIIEDKKRWTIAAIMIKKQRTDIANWLETLSSHTKEDMRRRLNKIKLRK